MKGIKNSTRLTIFSTLLLTAAIFALYVMMIADINNDMAGKGLDYTYQLLRPGAVMLLIVTAVLSYVMSSVVIDRLFNPIRLMIAKVREMSKLDFSKPLVLQSEDDELREYASAFNDMSQKLSGYIEKQKCFISDASHELVTPITVINGYADLLLRHGKEQPELLDGGLEIIKSEALRMDGLVDSLLLMARSDNGRQVYHFERMAIAPLIHECVSEMEVISPDFHFEINMDGDMTARCDEQAIRRLLRILLSNAVKYSGDSRMIRIHAHHSHGIANVSVKDNGIGIAPEHLPRIFDRFYRVDDSRTKKTGSSGLGLAIAREIVNAHGGDMQVSSEPGEGTEFCFLLHSD